MDANTTTLIVIYALSMLFTGYAAFRLGRQWETLQRTSSQAVIAACIVIIMALFAMPFAAKAAPMVIGWIFSALVLSAWTFLIGAISKGPKKQ